MEVVVSQKGINPRLMELFVEMDYIANQNIVLSGSLSYVISMLTHDQECSELSVTVPQYIDFSQVGRIEHDKHGYVIYTDDDMLIEVDIDPNVRFGVFDLKIQDNMYHKIKISAL